METLTFNPWRTFYFSADEAALLPSRVWQGELLMATNTTSSVAAGTPTTFRLQFDAPYNPDIPFEISIDGLFKADDTLALPTVSFRSATVVRPGFVLPY